MKQNVIVVMLDSLQFNYLGCYGNKWIKTPNLDRLAREGVLFENNYIEGVPTVPERDELYDRRVDPFQLRNLAAEKPGMASELYATLRDFMAELRSS